MLLIDGVKYNLWIPEKEEQFEGMIKDHSKEIFGEDSLYFDVKQKIISRAGIGSIPDGYLIRFKPSEWYIVEAELSSHPHEHVVMQLNRFMSGIRNFESQREITEALYGEIARNPQMKETVKAYTNTDDVHHFLTNLISKQPKILILIEQEDLDIQEACENLRVVPEIITFKTLVKEKADFKTHAHLYEPLVKVGEPEETTGERKREYPPHRLSWEKRLEWVDPSTRSLLPQVISRIEKEFPDASHLPKYRWYYVYKGSTHKPEFLFAVLLLTRKNIHIRIRIDPSNFRDEKNWTKAYQGWFWYKKGQERDFSITDADQLSYAIELIRQSYKLAQ